MEIRSAAALRHRRDHFVDERIEDTTWRANNDLAAVLRTKALDTVWGPPRHEHHVAGAKSQRLIAEPAFILSVADDVGFVVSRMAVKAGTGIRRLDCLA